MQRNSKSIQFQLVQKFKKKSSPFQNVNKGNFPPISTRKQVQNYRRFQIVIKIEISNEREHKGAGNQSTRRA